MEEIKHLSLDNLGYGAAHEMFGDVLEKTIENIIDPNTDWKTKRKITMELTIIPDESRRKAKVFIKIVPKLATQKKYESEICLGKAQGRFVAIEYGDIDQLDLFKQPQPMHAVKNTK